MPADPTVKSTSAPRKRTVQSKRGAIACVRCKERKARCVPAAPGTSNVPTCTNCHNAGAECIYLDRTPNELFLLEYVSQLETRVATLELELAKYQPNTEHTVDHSKTQAAAIESLTQQYPPGTWPVNGADVDVLGAANIQGPGLETSPTATEVKRESNEEEGQNDDLAYGLGMLSLSGSGEPVYVGASSGVNWARVCATPGSTAGLTSALSRFNYLAPPEQSTIESALSYSMHHPIPPLPSPPLAARYIEAAYQHIQARYGFLDWPTVRNWHENREAICLNRPLWGVGRGKDYRRNMAAFTLWLLYGYGARLTEDEKLEGAVSHEVYHNIAVACLSNVASHHSLATVQAELLLTIYSFRHPQPEISVWQTAGLALRTAIQIGLHRRSRSKAEREKDPMGYEIRKRAFWTVYTVDRMLALQLGRPSGIHDRDIDIEMPLNIDVEYNDPHEIFEMQNRQIDANAGRRPGEEYAGGYDSITSMTSAIHNVRLNQLKQLIQDVTYRLDQPLSSRHRSGSQSQTGPSPSDHQSALPEVDELLRRLSQWKACNPVLPPGRSGVPLLSKHAQDMEYHNCVQMLLRPVLSAHFSSQRYVSMCFESAASQCEIQWTALEAAKHKHYRLSNWALYRLFLSGLTLLHLASSPTTIPIIDIDRAGKALNRCKDCLQVFIRHLPAMKAYEDTFSDLVSAWETKGRVGANQVHEARMFASGPMAQIGRVQNQNQSQAQNHVQQQQHLQARQAIQQQQRAIGLAGLGGTPTPGRSGGNTANGNNGNNGNANNNGSPSQWLDLSHANTPQSGQNQNQNQNQAQSFSGMSGIDLSNFPFSTSPSNSTQFNQFGNMQQQGGYAQRQQGFGMSNMGAQQGWGQTTGPMLDQLSGPPGGGVRDDFSSLLSSLGVNMDDTIGGSFPAIAEDHLWTADWGLLPPATDEMGNPQSPITHSSLQTGTNAMLVDGIQTDTPITAMDPRAADHGGRGNQQGGRASTSPQTGFGIPITSGNDSHNNNSSADFWFTANGSNAGSSLGDRSMGGDDAAILGASLGQAGARHHRSNSNLGSGGGAGERTLGDVGGGGMDGIDEGMTPGSSHSFGHGQGHGSGVIQQHQHQSQQQQHYQHQHQHPGAMQLDQAMINDAVHALDGSMTEDIWKFPFG